MRRGKLSWNVNKRPKSDLPNFEKILLAELVKNLSSHTCWPQTALVRWTAEGKKTVFELEVRASIEFRSKSLDKSP